MSTFMLHPGQSKTPACLTLGEREEMPYDVPALEEKQRCLVHSATHHEHELLEYTQKSSLYKHYILNSEE